MSEIRQSTARISSEIMIARERAHAKHGDKSIEAGASPERFNSILVEEIGEVSKVINEFALGNINALEFSTQLRAELIDSATVCIAWIASLDTRGIE